MGDHAQGGGQVLTDDTTQDEAAQLLEAGRLLFARDVTFMRGVAALDGLPPISLPEVAFAGRSNVGKSSLINALCGRSTVARTSNTPGRTRRSATRIRGRSLSRATGLSLTGAPGLSGSGTASRPGLRTRRSGTTGGRSSGRGDCPSMC